MGLTRPNRQVAHKLPPQAVRLICSTNNLEIKLRCKNHFAKLAFVRCLNLNRNAT